MILRHKINTKTLKPGLVAAYDLRPVNQQTPHSYSYEDLKGRTGLYAFSSVEIRSDETKWDERYEHSFTRSLASDKERLTVVAVGVGQHRLEALCGRHDAGVGAVLAADFAVHAAEDLRRQMESVEYLVLPLMNGHAVLAHMSASTD